MDYLSFSDMTKTQKMSKNSQEPDRILKSSKDERRIYFNKSYSIILIMLQ